MGRERRSICGMSLDKALVQKIVEGKVAPGEVDAQVLKDYERAAKVMKATMMAKLLKQDAEPAEVVPGVYLGSIGAAQRPDYLREVGITHVLCVGKGLPRKVGEDFVFKALEVLDSAETKLSDYFEECNQFIEAAKAGGGRVYVHCFAGKSRSATIVIAYVLHSTGMEYQKAFDLAREARPQIDPNPGFCLQLVQYYKKLHPDRPPPGCEGLEKGMAEVGGGVEKGMAEASTTEEARNAFVEMVEKAGRGHAVLYRDEVMVIFQEKFGVCKHHLTITPAKPLCGVLALSRDDIPALRNQYHRGIEEFMSRTREMQGFQCLSAEDLHSVVVAGFFHPAALAQLQLHMLLPPFRSERVCAYPKWHSYEKVMADLETHGRVVSWDEAPNPEEGKRVQDAALALHRRFKKIEESVLPSDDVEDGNE